MPVNKYSLRKFWAALLSVRLRGGPSAYPIASWRLIPSLLLTCSMTLKLSPGLPLNATVTYFGASASAEDYVINQATTAVVDLDSVADLSVDIPVEPPTARMVETELEINLGKGIQVRLTGPNSFVNDPQHLFHQLPSETQEKFLSRRADILSKLAAFLTSARGGFGLYTLSNKIIRYVRPNLKSSSKSGGSPEFQTEKSSAQALTQALSDQNGRARMRKWLLNVVDSLLFMDPGTLAKAHTVGIRIVIGAIGLGGMGLSGGTMIVKAANKIPAKLGGKYVQAALASGTAQRIMSADIGGGGQKGIAISFGYNFQKGSLVAQAFPWREAYATTLGVAGYLGFNLRVGAFFDATSGKEPRPEYVLVPPGPGFMSKGEDFFSAGLNIPFAVPGLFPISELMGYKATAQVGQPLGFEESRIGVSRITPFFARAIPGLGWGVQSVENFVTEVSSYTRALAEKGKAVGSRLCQKLVSSSNATP